MNPYGAETFQTVTSPGDQLLQRVFTPETFLEGLVPSILKYGLKLSRVLFSLELEVFSTLTSTASTLKMNYNQPEGCTKLRLAHFDRVYMNEVNTVTHTYHEPYGLYIKNIK